MTPASMLTPPTGFEPLNLGDGYAQLFGNIYLKPEGESRILGFYVLPHHLNHFDVCHGGAVAFFADMQLIGVKNLTGNSDQHFPTKQLSIDFIAPAKQGDWLEMKVELVRKTNSSLYSHARINVDQRCIARTTAIYHIPRK